MFMNNVSIAGIVATDPIFRSNEDVNRNVLTFNLRVKRQGRGTDSDFFPVTVFGAYAKTMAELVAKGRKLGVIGSLRQNRWKDDAGSNRDRLEVVADHIALGDDQAAKPQTNKLAEALAAVEPAALAQLFAHLGAAKPQTKSAPPKDDDYLGDPPSDEELAAYDNFDNFDNIF